MTLTSDLNLFLTTTRIETSFQSKTWVATGFILNFNVFGGRGRFIVTNKHVVTNMDAIFLNFLKSDGKNPLLGNTVKYCIPNHEKRFIFHELYDLAILPFEPILEELKNNGETISYSSIRNLSFYSPAENMGIEDVYFIGYPDGLWDTANYLPILRKGLTATLLRARAA